MGDFVTWINYSRISLNGEPELLGRNESEVVHEQIKRKIFNVLSSRHMQRIDMVRLPLNHQVNYLHHMEQP